MRYDNTNHLFSSIIGLFYCELYLWNKVFYFHTYYNYMKDYNHWWADSGEYHNPFE